MKTKARQRIEKPVNRMKCKNDNAIDSLYLMYPRSWYEFAITHDIRDQFWAFWEDIPENKKSAITKVTVEDIKKRFKEFSKGQDCKCGGCIENRKTFEKGIQNIVTYIHTSLLDEYTCDTSLKTEHSYNDDGDRVDDWENYEDYWFDCLVPCTDDISFMLDEDIVKQRCLFMAFMEYFPAHSLVNESSRQIDASAVCHVVGGYDCFLFDDTHDYYICSDDDDNGDDDKRNGPLKKTKDGNTPFSAHSIADSVQKGLFYVIACVGIICCERIIHEFRDMLAALNREMLLKELEMEKYVQEDEETKSQKQAAKKKKKKRNIKEQQTSKRETKEHTSGNVEEGKTLAADVDITQTVEDSNTDALKNSAEESFLDTTRQNSPLYNKLREFAQSQINSIENKSPVRSHEDDHDQYFNVPPEKRAHSIKLLHQLLPSLADNNTADVVETGRSSQVEQELVVESTESPKEASNSFGLRESICEEEDPIVSKITRSPPGLAPIGTPTFFNGSLSALHCNTGLITNPYHNLAIENWIFRNYHGRVLFLYQNAPCVVIGRNQNPWLECNFAKMRELGMPLVRRQSGGGTVFHDLGNVNYCVMVPKKEFDMSKHCYMIKDALNNLSIPANVTKRNDIEVNGFKVSGSAYRIIRDKAFHHGTMLVATDTTSLRFCIGDIPHVDKIISKATMSVRSPVANIKDFAPRVSTLQFMEVVMAEFQRMYQDPAGIDSNPITIESSSEIANEKECLEEFLKLQTPEWIYGNTPDFEVQLYKSKLKIHRGLFHDIVDQDLESKSRFERIKGKYFSWDELKKVYSNL